MSGLNSCGDPIGCACPAAWRGVVPPPCPVHNPSPFGVVTVSGIDTGQWRTVTTAPPPDPNAPVSIPSCWPDPILSRLHSDDIERIALRVAELLSAASLSSGPLTGPDAEEYERRVQERIADDREARDFARGDEP